MGSFSLRECRQTKWKTGNGKPETENGQMFAAELVFGF